MLFKEFKSPKVKVQITKQPDRTKSKGFEYYITVLKAGIFGGWNIDDSYKQLKPITSEKKALVLAQFFFDDSN